MPRPTEVNFTLTPFASSVLGQTPLWAGSEASYEAVVEALAAIQAKIMDGSFKADVAEDEDSEGPPPYLLSKVGSIGIITIKGPLVNADSPYLRYFGVTGYPDIKRAALAASLDPSIKSVALYMGTPGGQVAGLNDTANVLAKLDKLKPVHTYTDSVMASAGLWLGSSARTMSADATAITGSLGVVAVHREASKMMEEMGIKETVIRAGKFKQQANSHEPLTEAAKASIEHMLQETYSVFLTHVAANRKMEYAKADSAFGQGREFVGQQGVDVGLIDKVTTFDKFITDLQASVDKKSASQQNAGNYQRGTLMYKTLSTVQVEAMKAQGMSTEQIASIDEAQAQANEKAAAEAKAKTEAEAAAALALQNASKGNDLSSLVAQISTQAVEIAGLKSERDAAKAQVTPLQEALSVCKSVMSASIATMRVALGQSASDTAAMTPVDLVALHATVEKDFKAKFPNGQVSATSSTAASTEADKNAEPAWARTAAAVAASAKA